MTARALTARSTEAQAGTLGARGVRIQSSASSLDEPFDNRLFVEWTATFAAPISLPVLQAMAQLIASPVPDPDAVARARDELADEVVALQDDSRWRANDAAWSGVYPTSHPLGRPVHGTTGEPVGDHGRRRLPLPASRTTTRCERPLSSPATSPMARRRTAVTAAFGGWRADATTGRTPSMLETPPPAKWPAASDGGGRDIHIAMPHKEQASIAVALPAAAVNDADHSALSLLNYLLGETGYAGRLGEQLVDTGIAYAVYASLWPFEGAGPLLVTTDAVQAGEAVRRMRAALAAFARQGVTAAQLDEAKGFVLGRLLYRFETPASASAAVADLASLGQGSNGLQAFGERIRAVTLAQLNAAAARYYDPSRAVFVTAGR